jgi:hypothetical protein
MFKQGSIIGDATHLTTKDNPLCKRGSTRAFCESGGFFLREQDLLVTTYATPSLFSLNADNRHNHIPWNSYIIKIVCVDSDPRIRCPFIRTEKDSESNRRGGYDHQK